MMNNILQELEAYAQKHHVPIITKESSQLLVNTVVVKKPIAVLEIGTAIGYSTILIAANLDKQTVITSIEIDPDRANIAKAYIEKARVDPEIHVLEGDAAQILPVLDGPFDLVFIDAAKGQYLNYLEQVLGKLNSGAVIIADNILFRGYIKGNVPVPRRFRTIVKRLASYLEFVTHDPRFDTVVHDIGDGVAITYYRGEI
ncbi:MAG: putative O-methyltransferase [Firmicutes bacterium]|nr:putative O-methyltransferase [Bacillota bacterium]